MSAAERYEDDEQDGFRTVYATPQSPHALPPAAADRRYVAQDPDEQCPGCREAQTSDPRAHDSGCSRVNPVRRAMQDNVALQAQPRISLPDDGFWRAENRRINAEKERIAADILNREFNSRMRAVIKEKRVSKVFKIWDWPRGVRDRGWGFLHDQIWFYDEPSWRWPAFLDSHPPEYGVATTCEPFVAPDGKWWRRDGGRWLRLYMDRRMLWLPRWVARLRIWNRFRLHHFFSGDDDSAPHDHSWDFWTIPFFRYTETVELSYEEYMESPLCKLPVDQRHVSWVQSSVQYRYLRVMYRVRRWWPQFRRAEHRHFVHEPARPFRTLVCARETVPARKWGFWPDPQTFVPHDVWTQYTK